MDETEHLKKKLDSLSKDELIKISKKYELKESSLSKEKLRLQILEQIPAHTLQKELIPRWWVKNKNLIFGWASILGLILGGYTYFESKILQEPLSQSEEVNNLIQDLINDEKNYDKDFLFIIRNTENVYNELIQHIEITDRNLYDAHKAIVNGELAKGKDYLLKYDERKEKEEATAYYLKGLIQELYLNFDKAENFYYKASILDTTQSLYLRKLGLLMAKNGQSKEATATLLKATELAKYYDKKNLYQYYSSLGGVYLDSGLIAQSIQVYDIAISILGKEPKNEKDSIALSRLFNLQGNVYREASNFDNAFYCLNRSSDLLSKSIDNLEDLAQVSNNLSLAYWKLAEQKYPKSQLANDTMLLILDTALYHATNAIDFQEKHGLFNLLQNANGKLAYYMNSKAQIRLKQGKAGINGASKNGRLLQMESCSLLQTFLPDHHPVFASCISNLGMQFMSDAKTYDKAKIFLDSSLMIFSKLPDPNHFYAGNAYHNRAKLSYFEKNYKEGIPYAERAIEIYKIYSQKGGSSFYLKSSQKLFNDLKNPKK